MILRRLRIANRSTMLDEDGGLERQLGDKPRPLHESQWTMMTAGETLCLTLEPDGDQLQVAGSARPAPPQLPRKRRERRASQTGRTHLASVAQMV